MDLFHASALKNHKASFETTYNLIEERINEIKANYENKWNELNNTRKKWAAIQENIILIVKSNGLKFSKSLDKCSQEEMIAEIKRLAKLLPNEEKQFYEYTKLLNNYYQIIINLTNDLETLSKQINLMNAPELDKSEELVIDLDKYRKKDSMEIISVYPASDEIIKSKNRLFKKNEVEEVPFIEVESLLVNGNVIEDNKKSAEEYIEYEIKGNMTLIDIASSVYGNGAYWRLLYLYSTNKQCIDSIAKRYDTTPEVISTIKGFLDGIKLKFPLELFELNDIYNEKALV